MLRDWFFYKEPAIDISLHTANDAIELQHLIRRTNNAKQRDRLRAIELAIAGEPTPSIMRMLDQRKQRIEEGLMKSEEAATQAEASEMQSQQVLAEARAEAQRLLAGASESASQLRTELEEQARADSERIRADAQTAIQAERDQAIQALRSEFADLTIIAAERVVGQSLDRDAHQRLIDDVLVDSSFGNGNN